MVDASGSPTIPPHDEAAWAEVIGRLPSGERSPFTVMTFTLTHDQADRVRHALGSARRAGSFGRTGNANSNGNALARLAEAYV